MTQSIIEASKAARGKKDFKKFLKPKYFIILGVVIALVLVYIFVFAGDDKKATEVKQSTWNVKQGDLSISIESDGRVIADESVDLSFSISGNDLEVDEMYVKEGDSILKGDKIAKANVDSLEFDLRNAYASYQSALAVLNARLASPTDESLARSLSSIEQAKVTLDQTKVSLEQTLLTTEQQIASAQRTLDTAKNNLKLNESEESSTIVNDAYEDLVSVIKSTAVTLAGALLDADNVLGVDNKSVNDDFEDFLGVGNSSMMPQAQNSYNLVKIAKNALDDRSLALSIFSDHNLIDEVAILAETALNSMQINLFDVLQVLNYSIASSSFTQTVLSGYKDSINSARSSVNSSTTSLVNGLQAINTAKNSLTSYQIAYDKAMADFISTRDQSDKDISNAQASVALKEISLQQAQINHDELIAVPREVDIASIRAQVTQAAVNVDKARYNVAQATLTAPIDGEVVELNYKKGDIIDSDNLAPVAVILNKDSLFVEVKIEEADINQIAVGQKAYVTFDAVADLELDGEVSFVSLTSVVDNNGITTYAVRIIIDNDSDSQIREGMTTFVDFVIAEVKDVLTVPVNAVRNVDGKPAVQIEAGEWLPVVTGFTDGEQVEVISGLEAGVKIVY